jgi:hypothetical protein
MRFCAAALLAAIACGFGSSASAVNLPPIGLSGVHIIKLSHEKKNAKACTAKSRSHTSAGKVSRQLSPVACEQPPRSKLLDAGFVILFAP